ncbi:MAG: polyprenyl synthetase family protein [Bacteroidia bacterium]|nr:polyprenyl synthetase family protein [Bacteroidia bacterium]
MTQFNKIKEPIAEDLQKFEPYFRTMMKSRAPLLNIITNYILKRKGKQMRPMFVFLTARMLGQVNQSTFHAASLIELMHTATLIHDDVVDDSYMRRGLFSINALWRNKIAVLVGDYLLSRGLLLAINNDEYQLLKVVSEAVREMSEGELLQIEKARKLDITEEIYFEIIRKKTAVLLSACSEAGALSVGAKEGVIQKMKEFGTCVGIAFQIRDDIFDYSVNGITGKPSGNDIREKKMTLPLIYVLNNSTPSDRRIMISSIKNNKSNNNKVKELIKYVVNNGGIKYAETRMREYSGKATEILAGFPDSQSKEALIEFVKYTIERDK